MVSHVEAAGAGASVVSGTGMVVSATGTVVTAGALSTATLVSALSEFEQPTATAQSARATVNLRRVCMGGEAIPRGRAASRVTVRP